MRSLIFLTTFLALCPLAGKMICGHQGGFNTPDDGFELGRKYDASEGRRGGEKYVDYGYVCSPTRAGVITADYPSFDLRVEQLTFGETHHFSGIWARAKRFRGTPVGAPFPG
jgi:hypothetical protein